MFVIAVPYFPDTQIEGASLAPARWPIPRSRRPWAYERADSSHARLGRTAASAGRSTAAQVFVRLTDGAEPPVLFLHGYPSSSYDWRPVLEGLAGHRSACFDFLGFGLSDKPRDHVYSLLGQADLAEAVVARIGATEVVLVAHDWERRSPPSCSPATWRGGSASGSRRSSC